MEDGEWSAEGGDADLELQSENRKWFIGVADYDLKDNGFIKGKMWVLDVMAAPEKKFDNGWKVGN